MRAADACVGPTPGQNRGRGTTPLLVAVLLGLAPLLLLAPSPAALFETVLALRKLLILPALVLLLWVALNPVVCGVGLLVSAFVNPDLLPPLLEAGPFTLRLVDLLLGLTAGVVALHLIAGRGVRTFEPLRRLFVPVLPFLAWIGISVLLVRAWNPELAVDSLASWLRLLATAGFAPLVYLSITTRGHLAVASSTMVLAVAANLGLAVLDGLPSLMAGGWLHARYGGALGINVLGLVCGLALVHGWIARGHAASPSRWLPAVTMGLVGLVLTKSTSSTVAAALAIAIYQARLRPGTASGPGSTMRLVLWSVLLLTVAGLATWLLRGENVVRFIAFDSSTFTERLMMALAGLRIFADAPLLGVGWQASGSPELLGRVEVNAWLSELFPLIGFQMLPTLRAMSVHSFYVQLLAELGFVGTVIFGFTAVSVGRAVAQTVRRTGWDPALAFYARFYAVALLLVLLWWNTNPLYGGQTESILAFCLLGLLAACRRLAEIETPDRGPRPAAVTGEGVG